MLSIDQCIGANRPLTFVVVESDVEFLKYVNENYKKDDWYVYSKTLSGVVRLKSLLSSQFNIEVPRAAKFIDVLSDILRKDYVNNTAYEKYIFLESDMYLEDKQNQRKIKDVLSRYQLDEEFTMNLVFVSQTVCVPAPLERLGEVAFFGLPDQDGIKKLSDHLSKKLELKSDQKPHPEVLNNLKGLTLFEIEQAYLQSFNIYHEISLPFIQNFKKNAIAKTELLSLSETDVSFDNDIGGMVNLKEWIKKSYGGWTVEGQQFGLPLLKGLLLVGATGAGKSLIMKGIGNEWGLPVINFDPTLIFSSRVGDSETNMHRVLHIVECMAPCVLSIDEIEKGFSGSQSSSFSDAGVTSRVIGTFLIWMQDCTKPVFTIATSNDIRNLPPELINRFDETFFVNIPQSYERRDIFSIHIQRLGRDPGKFDLDELAIQSKDLTGREIEQVLREGMYEAYYNKKELSTKILIGVLKRKTNILTTMAEQLKYLFDWVGWDEEKGDGLRARYSSPPDVLDIKRVKNEIDDILKDIEGKKPGM